MVDGTYAIEVDTPLGRKSGTIALSAQDGVLDAVVDAPIIGKRHGKGTVEGNAFTTSGEVKIKLLGTFSYEVKGEVMDDVLNAQIITNKGTFAVVGVRIA